METAVTAFKDPTGSAGTGQGAEGNQQGSNGVPFGYMGSLFGGDPNRNTMAPIGQPVAPVATRLPVGSTVQQGKAGPKPGVGTGATVAQGRGGAKPLGANPAAAAAGAQNGSGGAKPGVP